MCEREREKDGKCVVVVVVRVGRREVRYSYSSSTKNRDIINVTYYVCLCNIIAIIISIIMIGEMKFIVYASFLRVQ